MTSKSRAFYAIQLQCLIYHIGVAIGNVNMENIKIKVLHKSRTFLIHTPIDKIKTKLLGLTKIAHFDITVRQYDSDYKNKIKTQATERKNQQPSNKGPSNKVTRVIKDFIPSNVLPLKHQEEQIKEKCGFEVKLKEIQKANIMIATFDKNITIKLISNLVSTITTSLMLLFQNQNYVPTVAN